MAEITKVESPLYARHSEIQAILTLDPGEEIEAIIKAPDPGTGIIITGIDGDFEPEKIYVKVQIPHPFLEPHEGYLTPALLKVVNQNFQYVKPLIKYDANTWARFRFKNVDTAVQDFEIVLGILIGPVEVLEKVERARRA